MVVTTTTTVPVEKAGTTTKKMREETTRMAPFTSTKALHRPPEGKATGTRRTAKASLPPLALEGVEKEAKGVLAANW
jgi:hypothetical protein